MSDAEWAATLKNVDQLLEDMANDADLWRYRCAILLRALLTHRPAETNQLSWTRSQLGELPQPTEYRKLLRDTKTFCPLIPLPSWWNKEIETTEDKEERQRNTPPVHINS